MTHLQRWVKTLIDGLDAQVDEETRAEILEACGRACIPRSFIRKAQACGRGARDTGSSWIGSASNGATSRGTATTST
jgi:hypothetical protein